MLADSNMSDDDRTWSVRKVWHIKDMLVGAAGNWDEIQLFLNWLRRGRVDRDPPFRNGSALLMTSKGLVTFSGSCVPTPVPKGVEAIGTGGKAVMCTYEALGWTNPKRAMNLVCKYDAGSRGPVRSYRLNK